MFILNFFADLMSKKSLSGAVSEPLTILFFGIAIFAVTAILRSFLNRQEKPAKKVSGKMKKAVVLNNN